MDLLTPYADLPPYRTHAVEVGGGHRLHVAEFGREDGLPALVLHGGPGSGVSPLQRRFFDPARYRIICPDQRGAGRSTPHGETAHNTTPDLLDDLATVRALLGVSRWLVVGGSWGATLAVLHAAAQPDAVSGLLLRSVFLARPRDIADFFDGIALDDVVVGGGGREPAAGPLAHLKAALGSADEARRRSAARCWLRQELAAGGREAALADAAGPLELEALVPRYRIQGHYLAQACGLSEPLLQRAPAVPPVPTLLLHGSDDRTCLPEGALALHARLPGASLQWVPGCGHDLAHPRMVDAMVRSLDRFAERGRWDEPSDARLADPVLPDPSPTAG